MWRILTAVAVIFPTNCAAIAADRLLVPICTVDLHSDPRGGTWPLFCIDGKPYFEVAREQRAGDRPVRWPWKSHDRYAYFQMAGVGFDYRSKKLKEGDTTLRNLGVGGFNEGYTEFRPGQKTPRANEPPVGYLTVDYSTKPPSVKLNKSPSKFSTWKITRGEQDGDWYIGNIDGAGKTAWLSLSGEPETVVQGHDQGRVIAFHGAVLSYDSKPAFRIVVQNDGR